jgi:hypothetical protein
VRRISKGRRAHLLALCERATYTAPTFDLRLLDNFSDPMQAFAVRFNELMLEAGEAMSKAILGSSLWRTLREDGSYEVSP